MLAHCVVSTFTPCAISVFTLFRINMGDLRLKQQKDVQENKSTFVLSDVSKEELQRRRISVYQYLL
ncbi:hypothetical protein D2S45_03215 [Prevotella intermedia]|uniref:Uncharacterized protein n=1 Tax=Prevotella intermedia TaxID=28131 RepID=A0A3R8G7D3_PREIN|nr:hypothetical protein D2S53_01825 [Prevotella intermedia]RRF87917.1 hypothetical protein D2S45_03215 [Prevotella intermedia]